MTLRCRDCRKEPSKEVCPCCTALLCEACLDKHDDARMPGPKVKK
jgi:hypothetical protein